MAGLAAVGLSAEAISTAVAAISAGSSVVGNAHTMVQSVDDGRKIVVGVEVCNATKYFLKSEGYFAAWGHVKSPPSSVKPGTKEVIIALKSWWGTVGASGYAVWKIGDTNTRLIVMWDDPYWSANVLGIGFKEGEVDLSEGTYQQLHDDKEPWCKHQEYAKSGACRAMEMTHSSKQFKVQGSMGTEDKCEAKLEFLPLTKDAVASSLKNVVFGCQ